MIAEKAQTFLFFSFCNCSLFNFDDVVLAALRL